MCGDGECGGECEQKRKRDQTLIDWTTMLFFSIVLIVLFSSLSAANNSTWYRHFWCRRPGGLRFLDDNRCQRVFPSVFDRNFTPCAWPSSSAVPAKYRKDSDPIVVDRVTLAQLQLPDEFDTCVIAIKRTPAGEPRFLYLCTSSNATAHETWSSSKVFAALDGAAALEKCGGLDALGFGKHGVTALGDLVTIIVTYDETALYTSNALAKWFATVGNHTRLNRLVQHWIGAGNESLGGSYGAPIPPDLRFSFRAPSSQQQQCTVAPDLGPIASDTLSSLTMAELLRRIVLHREIAPQHRWPGVAFQSIQDVLFGASPSRLFAGLEFGGMSADTGAMYIQQALNMSDVDARTGGRWNIFSKLGAGRQDIVLNAYACLGALEFVISARATSRTSLNDTDQIMQKSLASVVRFLETL
jgi:hypothetical protein